MKARYLKTLSFAFIVLVTGFSFFSYVACMPSISAAEWYEADNIETGKILYGTSTATNKLVGVGPNKSNDRVDIGEYTNPVSGKCPTGYTHVDLDDDGDIDSGECFRGMSVKDGKVTAKYFIGDGTSITGLVKSAGGTSNLKLSTSPSSVKKLSIGNIGSGYSYIDSIGGTSASPNPLVLNSSGGGNVGIGITNPGARLHVGGNMRLNNEIRFKNNTGMKGLVWGDTSWKNYYSRIDDYSGQIHIMTDDNFYISDINTSTGAPGTNRFYVNTDTGNVGIGTTSPSGRLHIENRGDTNLRLKDTGTGSEVFLGAPVLYRGVKGTGGVGTVSNHDFPIFTNNHDRLTIKSDGSIRSEREMRFKNNSGMKGLVWGSSSWGGYYSRIDDYSGNMHIMTDDNFYIDDINSSNGTPGTNRFYINTNTGKVGIGTTSPETVLHIKGNGNTDTFLKLESTAAAGRSTGGGVNSHGFWLSHTGPTTSDDNMIFQAAQSGNWNNYTKFMVDPGNGFSFTTDGTATGNVGIGTTIPTKKLHIAGTQSHFYVDPDYKTSTTRLSVGAGQSLRFGTGGTETIQIDSSGKVGIGKTNPSTKLDVNGTVKATKFSGSGSSLTGVSASTIQGKSVSSTAPTTDQVLRWVDSKWTPSNDRVGTSTANYVSRWDSTKKQLVKGSIYDSGNVGIGTTSPSMPLHVFSASDDKLKLEDTDGTWFSMSTGSDVVGFDVPSGDDMKFRDGTDVNMYIKSNGNVGIGTSNPRAALEIKGDLHFDNQNGDTSLIKGGAIGSEGKISLYGLYSNMDFNITHGINGKFQFQQDGVTKVLIDPKSGKVGIGTMSPDRLLHAESATSLTNTVSYAERLTHTTSGTPAKNIGVGMEFEVETAASNNEILGAIACIASDTTSAKEDGDIVFKTMTNGAAATEKMRIKSTGNVGIGTTSPDGALHIAHSGHTPSIILEGNTTLDPMIKLTPPSGFTNNTIVRGYNYNKDFTIWTGTAGNETCKFYLQGPTGKVGIGTTDPKGKLDVNGKIYQRGSQLHADYVFEPDYDLESIREHADFMWENRHLKAVPQQKIDEDGMEIIEVGSHRKGMLEELEKAHIYIAQLEERLAKIEAMLSISD